MLLYVVVPVVCGLIQYQDLPSTSNIEPVTSLT